MLDLIYVVEELPELESTEYAPNFTIPSRESPITAKSSITGASAASAAATVARVALNPFSLPTTLIASAVMGTPSLVSMVIKDRIGKAEELEREQAQEARLLAQYVARHSVSPLQARAAGYRFQPGHPVVGKTYRRHPLNDYENAEHKNLYIPSDSYDAILLEERESELIKLLVHLGATKIEITKKNSARTRNALNAGAKVQVRPVAGGGAAYTSESQHDADALDIREFRLSGRTWAADTKVARDQFCWLPYEPSWKAVVFAREIGGCLTASVEIKENTSFSLDRNLELSVQAKQVEVGAQAGMTNGSSEERTYIVRAEFAPVQ